MKHFTENYPGPRRITFAGHPQGDQVVIKCFGPDSYMEAATPRARMAGRSGGCYPFDKIIVDRSGMSDEQFRDAVKTACINAAEKHRRPVVDSGHIWGFYAEQETPFDDPIPF